jgi:hypothetical protein
MLAHSGQTLSNVDPRDGRQLHKIEDGYAAIRRRNVRVQSQAGPQEGGTVLAQKLNHARDEQDAEQEKHTEVARPIHRSEGLLHVACGLSHMPEN